MWISNLVGFESCLWSQIYKYTTAIKKEPLATYTSQSKFYSISRQSEGPCDKAYRANKSKCAQIIKLIAETIIMTKFIVSLQNYFAN